MTRQPYLQILLFTSQQLQTWQWCKTLI